eukprot:316003-Prymnesium_polylepis.1
MCTASTPHAKSSAASFARWLANVPGYSLSKMATSDGSVSSSLSAVLSNAGASLPPGSTTPGPLSSS